MILPCTGVGSKCSDTIVVVFRANGYTPALTSLLQSAGCSHQENGFLRSVARSGSKASVSTDDRQLPNAPDISIVEKNYAQVQDENAKALKYLTEAYQNGGSTAQVLRDSCRYHLCTLLLPVVSIGGRRIQHVQYCVFKREWPVAGDTKQIFR